LCTSDDFIHKLFDWETLAESNSTGFPCGFSNQVSNGVFCWVCTKHGQVAWTDGNDYANGHEGIIGGADETCYIVSEVNELGQGYIVVQNPGTWFRGR